MKKIPASVYWKNLEWNTGFLYLSAESNRVYLPIFGFPWIVVSNSTKYSTRKYKVFRHGAGYGQNTYQ